MKFYQYKIASKNQETEGTYIFRLQPLSKTSYLFEPGQYAYLKDPQFIDPEETHPFSIASSPFDSPILEFCVKEYGDWTHEIVKRKIGDKILVSGAQGSFLWQEGQASAVFLLGGIGIAPVISMLRTFVHKNTNSQLTLLYGNRNLKSIAYEKDLQQIQKKLPNLKVVHVFSDLGRADVWEGYRGFITEEIIKKEVSFNHTPMFYFIGPDIFVQKMQKALQQLHVDQNRMITESLS